MAYIAQRGIFSENPVITIKEICDELAKIADYIIQVSGSFYTSGWNGSHNILFVKFNLLQDYGVIELSVEFLEIPWITIFVVGFNLTLLRILQD